MSEHRSTVICEDVCRELQHFWLERRLHELLGEQSEAPVRVAQHLLKCRRCQREAESMVDLERTLEVGFAEFDRQAHLPDDQVTRILDRVVEDPSIPLLRRTRRSVRTILWLCLFLFSVFGCSALLALAYKIFFAM